MVNTGNLSCFFFGQSRKRYIFLVYKYTTPTTVPLVCTYTASSSLWTFPLSPILFYTYIFRVFLLRIFLHKNIYTYNVRRLTLALHFFLLSYLYVFASVPLRYFFSFSSSSFFYLSNLLAQLLYFPKLISLIVNGRSNPQLCQAVASIDDAY